MEEWIEVESQYRLLICRRCRAAVRPGASIEEHFRHKHKLRGQVLRDIIDYFGSMQLEDPASIALPADGSAATSSVDIHAGLRCTACGYITTARDSMVKHWRTAGHEGCTQRWQEVEVQTWMRNRHTRYWVVRSEDGAESTQGLTELDKRLAAYEVKQAAEDEARLRRGDQEEGIDRDSAWVKYMGWVGHFQSRDKMEICRAAQWVNSRDKDTYGLEDGERARLVRLGRSFDTEVERCCWRLTCVPVETLQWLASYRPDLPSGVPFGRKAKEASMTKYRSVGHRYLGFCVQAFWLGRDGAFEKLAIKFTDEQWSLLGDLVLELDTAGRDEVGSCAGEESRGESGSVSTEDEVETASAAGDSGRLDTAVFRFIVASIKQGLGGSVYESPAHCFLAALGVRTRPLGYTEAHLYTGLMAGFLWWARLFFLDAAFAGEADDVGSITVEKVRDFREEHKRWMCVGSHTVISNVIRCMAYGKGYRMKMGGQPSVRWEDDGRVLVHQGERISVEDFKRTFRDLVDKAEGLLDKLMAGGWRESHQRPDLSRIRDTMIREGAGKSFATDDRNRWLQAGAGKVVRLAGSALWDEQGARWKTGAVERRMRWLGEFREMLMILVHVWGGQPGRGPELTTMRH